MISLTKQAIQLILSTLPKTIARPSDQPGSPAGWGAVDPTWAYSDSDEEL